MATSPIRVVVADDHWLFRSSLIHTLNSQPSFAVVGYGQNADDAVALASALEPDLILLDLNMPGDGIAAAAVISQLCPGIRSVILSAHDDDEAIFRAQGSGACGYILKGVSGRNLVRLLYDVYQGGTVWPTREYGEW